jgi:hypothetical protein
VIVFLNHKNNDNDNNDNTAEGDDSMDKIFSEKYSISEKITLALDDIL